jgi:hypothetical protein
MSGPPAPPSVPIDPTHRPTRHPPISNNIPPPPPLHTQYLYTLSVADADKAEKLTQSLPPGLQRKDIK